MEGRVSALDGGTLYTLPRFPAPVREVGAVGHGRCCGSFGELLQGALPGDDQDFLVTLPIRRWSRATFAASPRSRDEVCVMPPEKTKAREVVQRTLAACGLPPGGRLTVTSELPEGKGLASSTADMVAAVRAVCAAHGRAARPLAIEGLLRGIEPADGVMYAGVVAYHHRQVRLRRRLGALPELAILAIDEGGAVDTLAFNRLPRRFAADDREEYEALLSRMERALAAGDLVEVGRISTRSAELHQRRLPKRWLGDVLAVSEEIGGLGVGVTHSGTCLGILFDRADEQHRRRVERGRQLLGELGHPAAVISSA
ncbi:MAG: kinase [bacterium]|nr:kinase [bacterium]